VLRARIQACKREGMSSRATSQLLQREFAERYPDWGHLDFLAVSIDRIYAEL
jgi:hypothetical protein